MKDFVGQNFRGMMLSLEKLYDLKLSPEELEKYVVAEEDRVIATLEKKAQPCLGANEQLERMYKEGKYGMAVVSSSALRRVKASILKAGQADFFPKDAVYSAATSLPKPTSKPDPAIYLFACEQLGKKPEECIAVEDSKSGATSGFRAGIHVLGYTGCYDTKEKRDEVADVLRQAGAKVIMEDWKDFPECVAEIEKNGHNKL